MERSSLSGVNITYTSADSTPVAAIFSFLMLIGVIGNPLIIYFFGIRQPPRATYMFIATLAVFDLIISCTSVPFEIYSTIHLVDSPSRIICKLSRYVNYLSSNSTGCIILAVTIERYRKICLGFSTSIQRTRTIIAGVCLGSVLISLPAGLLYSRVDVDVEGAVNMTLYICGIHKTDRTENLSMVYHTCLLSVFSLFVTVLCVLYYRIHKSMNREKPSRERYTRIMVCISVCYVVGYVPCLSILIWKSTTQDMLQVNMSRSAFMAFNIFLRSFLFNVAINPIIYGFLNAGFRDFVFYIPKKICLCCTQNEMNINDDTEERRQLLR